MSGIWCPRGSGSPRTARDDAHLRDQVRQLWETVAVYGAGLLPSKAMRTV